MEKQTMTVKETAAYFGVHADTIYEMVRQNELPHIRIRGKILFWKKTMDDWIKEQEAKNASSFL